jgi:peptide/nickel transport system substrate-binding protein
VLAALGAVLLAGAIGVAAVAMLNRPESAAALGAEPDSVVFLDPANGKLVAEAPVRQSRMLRFGGGFLWSSNDDGTLDQIDPKTHKLVRTIPIGVHPGGMAVGEGAVWITDAGTQTLLRLNPQYGTVDRIALPSDGLRDAAVAGGVAVGAGSVWVAHGSSEVVRLDPDTGDVRRRYPIPYAARVNFAEGAVWVDMLDARIAVARIDPATNAVTRPVPWFRAYGCCSAVGGGFIWVVTVEDHKVWKIDLTQGGPLDHVELPGEVSDITYGDGALWATTGKAGAVVRIDPETARTRSFMVGHAATAIAVSGGRLAVGVRPRAEDVTAGLSGRVARLPMITDLIGNTDPAISLGLPYRWQLQYATCAKLFNHPDAPAPAGWQLVPEVAAGLPAVSADGLTQTFRIRSGFRFSPPLNAPVTAETFRHTIERALSPALGPGADGAAYLPELAGLADYRAGRAEHISGLSAHGDTLTTRLTSPVPDLPERLALPQFCAVPDGTPVAPDGLPQPMSSAGPYYISDYFPNEALVVKRNPNYRGSRPHQLDAIVYEFGVKTEDSVGRVERGLGEVLEDYTLDPHGPVAQRYGREPSRFFFSPQLSNVYLAFNTHRPLFARRRVRQAVNYALDRQAIATTVGYLPADHYLPSGIPGHRATHVYPTRPDLRRARALIQDDGGPATLYFTDIAALRTWAQIIRRNLPRIGIRVRVREYEEPMPDGEFKDLRADMLLTKTQASYPPAYPDPVMMLEDVLAVPESPVGPQRSELERWYERGTPPGWSDFSRLRAKLARIKQLGGDQRATAAGSLDLELARAAPGAAILTETNSVFYSRRVGCQTYQPLYYGVDLAALCLKTN